MTLKRYERTRALVEGDPALARAIVCEIERDAAPGAIVVLDDPREELVMMQVREQLVRQFSLDAFARHEGLSVEDADIDSFFDAISPNNAVAARKDFERSGKLFAAKGAALRLKANRLLAEQAVVHDAAAHRVG